jgi:hypothetical protein
MPGASVSSCFERKAVPMAFDASDRKYRSPSRRHRIPGSTAPIGRRRAGGRRRGQWCSGGSSHQGRSSDSGEVDDGGGDAILLCSHSTSDQHPTEEEKRATWPELGPHFVF